MDLPIFYVRAVPFRVGRSNRYTTTFVEIKRVYINKFPRVKITTICSGGSVTREKRSKQSIYQSVPVQANTNHNYQTHLFYLFVEEFVCSKALILASTKCIWIIHFVFNENTIVEDYTLFNLYIYLFYNYLIKYFTDRVKVQTVLWQVGESIVKRTDQGKFVATKNQCLLYPHLRKII